MLDGRHTGTGGGNHVVVGGATPNDSPFLRRPDLLKSSIAPTGSATPRSPTCSRACSSAPPARRRASTRPATTPSTSSRSRWRRFRRPARAPRRCPGWSTGCSATCSIDVTGNTHRSEICIDKLFSPDGPTGRLGLVEFRGFEMPPNARMSLAQQLLGARDHRALLEANRSTGDLVRWGTALHDRFMLPHYRLAGLLGRARRPRATNGFAFRSRSGSRPSSNSASPSSARSARRRQARAAAGARALARDGRSRARSAVRCASSTPPSNGCRSS